MYGVDPKFNQKGFSIAQVAIAMSLMSVMSLGLVTMVQNQANTIFYLEDQMSHQNLKAQVETMLRNNSVCERSLTNIAVPTQLIGANPNATADFILRQADGTPVFDPASSDSQINSFDQLKISSLKIQNIDLIDPLVGGRVNLIVDMERKRGSAKNNRQAMRSVIVEKLVTVNASLEVTGCQNVGDSGLAVGECLENSGGSYLGYYRNPATNSLENVETARVPSDAKGLKIVLPGQTCSGGSSSSNSDWNGQLFPAELTLILNGKSTLGNRPLVAGGTLTLSMGEIKYNGSTIVQVGTCSEFSNPHSLLIPSSNLTLCHKSSDFQQRTDGRSLTSLTGFTGASASYWK